MFFNKPVNENIIDKIYFRTNTTKSFLEVCKVDRNLCSIYSSIISNIDAKKQYDRYYFITSNLAFIYENGRYTNYIDTLHEFIDNIITDTSIMSDLQTNKALLIFDFSCELIPISLDESTLYGKINKIFKNNNCSSNVKYWSMFEKLFDIIDKNKCSVEIISVSITVLRYTEFDYNKYEELIFNNDIHSKSALYLNGRNRYHRIKLLAECIKNNVDIDYMHFSYVDYDTGFDYDYLIDKKIKDKYFGRQLLPNKNVDINHWLSSSSIERVYELLNYRAKSKFEIVTEYSFEDLTISLSEKFSLPILSKIPFVILGDKGCIAHLNKLGFKTFYEFWDESYDMYKGDNRIKALASIIKHIQENFKCEIDQYGNFKYTNKMKKILEHNYSHYKNVYAPRLQHKILKSLQK